jgi:hypothetical protein
VSEHHPFGPDTPLSLDEAAAILLRGLVKAPTLRAAAARGELTISRLGRRIVVTPAAVDAWRELCRDREKARASICAPQSAKPAPSSPPRDGSSATAEVTLARDSAQKTIEKLKSDLRTTKPKVSLSPQKRWGSEDD